MSVCQNVLLQIWAWLTWGVLALHWDLVNFFCGYRFALVRFSKRSRSSKAEVAIDVGNSSSSNAVSAFLIRQSKAILL